MKVLVIGATGSFAGLVVPELNKRGVTVRALVRAQDRVPEARRRGADETVVGDLRNPATLRAAAQGVDGVFHINPAFAPGEAEMGVAMVQAAKSEGVRKFVFSSVIHPSISTMVNHAAKQPVEEALFESGMDYTILQPAMFMQMLEGVWSEAVRTGEINMPYSKFARMCYVDYRDVAEAVALAFTDDALSYGTFELSAPGMFNRVELAALISDMLGRTIRAGETPPQVWAARARIPAGPMRDGLARMFVHYDQFGLPGGNALVLRAILRREPRTVSDFLRELAEAGIAQVGVAK